MKCFRHPTFFLLAVTTLSFSDAFASDAGNDDSSSSTLNRSYRLYPGITQTQSDLAHVGLHRNDIGNLKGAFHVFAEMEKLENKDSLPPLSQLLMVATGVLALERGDVVDEEDATAIRDIIENAAEQGRYLSRQALDRNHNHPTYLLIQGGIQGFMATEKIHSQPTRALQDGFQALRLLEKSYRSDGRIKDAFLGSGIFDCSAASAPLVVRGALKLIGRSANFHQGIRALRISAYEGQYTSVASQLFLIQFLSPYDTASALEKRVIFKSLRANFPTNPMYAFLEQDELLCFRPDSFYSMDANRSERHLKILRPVGYAGMRYLNLIKLQLALLHNEGSPGVPIDSAFSLREWEYYPVFLEGLRHKNEFMENIPQRDPALDPQEVLAAYRDSCLSLIAHSGMTSTAKRYQSWRVRDALRMQKKAPAAYAEPSSTN